MTQGEFFNDTQQELVNDIEVFTTTLEDGSTAPFTLPGKQLDYYALFMVISLPIL